MTEKIQYFEWDVPSSQVNSEEKVGYEFVFSNNPTMNPVLYQFSTYKEGEVIRSGLVSYSLDNGETWVDYPIGENGKVFTSPYRMRVKVETDNFGFILAKKENVLYQLTGDGSTIVTDYVLPDGASNLILDIIEKDNVALASDNQTLFKVKSDIGKISPYKNSINLIDEALDVVFDSDRDSFWQINSNSICLKKNNGETIFCTSLSGINIEEGIKGVGFGKIGIDFGVG